MEYVFTNCLGTFAFDKNANFIGTNPSKNAIRPEGRALKKILAHFKDKKYFDKFHKELIRICKKDMKNAFNDDHLIIQSIKTVEDVDKISNMLAKRLREWHEIYNPELSHAIDDHEKFVAKVIEGHRKQSFGKDMKESDLRPIVILAERIDSLYKTRDELKEYIITVMERHCPNILDITGPTIGARLIALAGSLRRIATLPSTIVQLLGAEKALFKHITTNAKSPKYGVIVNHPLIQSVPRNIRGKAARALAAKISLASRLDYFHGERKGKEMLKEIESKFR